MRKKYTMDLSLIQEIKTSNFLIEVNSLLNRPLFKEVYKIAKYFKEESNYDRVPFDLTGMLPTPYKVFLFTEIDIDEVAAGNKKTQRIYGACLFSKKSFSKSENIWVLEWIWLHPFFRHRGFLKEKWTFFQDEFGDFFIGKPVSPNMEAFLESQRKKSGLKHHEIFT